MVERNSFHPTYSLVNDERLENVDLHRRLIEMCDVEGVQRVGVHRAVNQTTMAVQSLIRVGKHFGQQ